MSHSTVIAVGHVRGRGRGSGGSRQQQTGRQTGIPNYQSAKLLDVIEAVKPVGSQVWERVARDYKSASGETFYAITNM